LASYKLEGDALNWWKVFKQSKGGETYVATLSWKDFHNIFFLQYFPRSEQHKYEREYHMIRQRDGDTGGEFMKRFHRLTGFVGNKAGPLEEHAKHFKWALSDCILDGIVNMEFADVAQVANAARNIKILRERSSQNNKRNRDGDCIRPTTQRSNQRGYDQKRYDRRGYDRQGQKGYPDYASSPPCDTCGKLHPGKSCHRVTRACFTCGLTGHMARDCPKNGGNGGRGNGNNKQPAAKGQVFSLTKDQSANSLGTISGTLFLNGHVIFVLFDTGATHSVVSVSFAKHISISPTLLNYTLSISTPMKSLVIIDYEYQNCPLQFDDKIRFANMFPLDMNDFDIILGMDWLTEHRATIVWSVWMHPSPIPTLRIHKDHPKGQILGDPTSAVQTRGKIQKASSAQQALVSYIHKQNRTNHKDHQNCLFACFLSQEEPKTISQALQDESWVEAMQEELLQFKLQKVWVLVDLPYGKKTKVYVHQPSGIVNPAKPNKGPIRNQSSFYGQHQAPNLGIRTAILLFLMEKWIREVP
ncbi:putative reverse transcriptase domain-containing protein, partial [Tanacetum coccineum]